MYSYTFNLDDGDTMTVYRFVYEPLNSNMYIIIRNGEAVVIDPNVSVEARDLLDSKGVSKVDVLLTHEHFDHTSGLGWFRDNYDCTVILSEICADIVKSAKNNNPMLVALVLAQKDKKDGGCRYREFKANFAPYGIVADRTVSNNESIRLIGHSFTFRYTPGHSPASLCIECDDTAVWTGDSLIRGTRTITRFKESSKADYENVALPYLRSVKSNVTIFPGHFAPFKMQDINIDDIRF